MLKYKIPQIVTLTQLIGILLQITIQFHYYAQSMKIKV